MPTKVKRTLLLASGDNTGNTYLTADKVHIDSTILGYNLLVRLYMNGTKDGYAILNNAAKAILYPNDKAHPVEADSYYHASVQTSNNTCYIALEFDGTEIQKVFPKNSDGADTNDNGMVNSAILQSSRNSVIRFHLHANNTVNAVVLTKFTLSLYFMQYACAAKSVSSTVTATVDKAEAYDGDTVTFTATLAAGATFNGWYSDTACTQLVSTNLTYTTVAADLTLYAKATQTAPTGTGVYIKRAGAQIQAAAVWRKANGLWVKADKTAIEAGKNYRMG